MFEPINDALMLSERLVQSTNDIIAVYQSRIPQFGYCGRLMFYRSEEQYNGKLFQYQQLLRSIVTEETHVLDVGCGFGPLIPLLPDCNYIGIDPVPEFIDKARITHPDKEFHLSCIEDFNSMADVVVLLGVVNGIPKPADMIRRAWGLTRRHLVFDVLDKNKYPDGLALNRFDVEKMCADLTRSGAASCRCIESSHTWTIIMASR